MIPWSAVTQVEADFHHFGHFRKRIARRPWAATFVECRACTHVFSNPQPTPADLARYYQSDYHVFKSPITDPRPIAEEVVRRGDQAYMHLPVIRGGAFLDVGCATGECLAVMQALGMRVRGVEVSPVAGRIAQERGLDIIVGTLDQAALPDAAFDVVGMSHVLEHIQDPVPVLEECRRVLVPGGRLVVGVPNIRSLGFESYGSNWIGLDPPVHVHQFTPDSLKAAAQRAGFKEMKVITEAYEVYLQGCHVEQLHRRTWIPRRFLARSAAVRQRAVELADKANASDRGDNLFLIATR
jgi:SAM-dependent methyltransferase